MEKPFITVFTPVFNGEDHLHRVFRSIENQQFRNFEWIIVNDGSTDRTAEIVRRFIVEHPELNIIFLEQPNSGKHIAWNKAVEIAKGELFVPADADDSFMPEALLFFYNTWMDLQLKEKYSLSGINVQCFDNDTDNIVGSPYPVEGMKSSNLELVYKYKMQGEKWGCIRVDLLKSRPFPAVKGSCAPLSYLWLSLSKKYKVICYNKPLRRYYTTSTGITQTARKDKFNPVRSKVILNHNLWLIKNFGLYVILNSPEEFLRTLASTVLRSISLLKYSIKRV